MRKTKKIESTTLGEKILYLTAAVLVPCAPLFFLYNQNATEGLQFSYCVIFGAALAIFSVIIHIVLSFVMGKRGAALMIVMLFWAAFWYFDSLHGVILLVTKELVKKKQRLPVSIVIILTVIAAVFIILNHVKLNKLVSTTVALVLCMLFAFNFVPAAIAVTKEQMAKSNEKPYELKSKFNVNKEFPRPNVYWLHMDGMMGFSAFEQYFGDLQTELKNTLNELGFVINEDARTGGGMTMASVPGLLSPTFLDTWLSAEYERNEDYIRMNGILDKATEQGFSIYEDIYSDFELMKAFSDIGYKISGNAQMIQYCDYSDVVNDGEEITFVDSDWREIENTIINVNEFKDFVLEASVLKVAEKNIDTYFKKIYPKKPEIVVESIPEYTEVVDKYLDKYSVRNSDSEDEMKKQIRAVKYATDMEGPNLLYFNDSIAHCMNYKKSVGRVFDIGEDGNLIDLESVGDDSIYDLNTYFTQKYKYSVKQMMAKVDVIIENDPDAVIVIQGDHGIHGLGPPGTSYFHKETFEKQGYSFEDMKNLNRSVISAVRIPEKYGKLSRPLEPMDIARYIVNNFVGEDNYDYLYYND